MNRKDWLPVIIIVALFLAYPVIDRKIVAKWFPAPERPVAAEAVEPTGPADVPEGTEIGAADENVPAEVAAAETAAVEVAETAPEVVAEEAEPEGEAAKVVLETATARYVLTARGGGVEEATLTEADKEGRPLFPKSADALDEPISFDFSGRPAGAAIGWWGKAGKGDFAVVEEGEGKAVLRKSAGGVTVTRTVEAEGYVLRFRDEVANRSGAALDLGDCGMWMGWMENLPGEADARMPTLGLDTLEGSSVKFWGNKFEKWFPAKTEGAVQEAPLENAAEWVAVKNKYFVQLARPEDGGTVRATAAARRGAPVAARRMLIFPGTDYPMGAVAASWRYAGGRLGNGETGTYTTELYVGPKVYGTLKANGYHEEDVLQLGFWRVIGIWILKVMVWFRNSVWPHSYGLAIIFLTVLIRVIFWPLNKKSMDSTRRMQEIQPLMAAVREKYKDNPQRQQQETMRLYKEHKINPLGGCLPMLIQIPVFFALFVVLRGAIELRYSSFLWIADLSTPENLFADWSPVPLNILPILMGLTMWWQQKLTPTSDPQQQKMMLMMPILFTVLFYNFPSGLSLYWTTNQVLMIVQLSMMKKKNAAAGAAAQAQSGSPLLKKKR